MALIGDILVKFVADFAQFTTSMTDATRQIGAFGQKIDEQNNVLAAHGTTLADIAKKVADLGSSASADQFASKVEGMAASLGRFGAVAGPVLVIVLAVIEAFKKVQQVEDFALAVDKLETQFKLTSDQAQVLQLAAERTGLSADDLRKRIASIPGEWDRMIAAARGQNLLKSNLDDAAKASKNLSAAWDDFMLALSPSGSVINATIAVLNSLTNAVHGLANAINEALKVHIIDASSVPSTYAGVAGAYQRGYQVGPQAADPYGLNAYRAQAFAQANGLPSVAATPGYAAGAMVGAPIQFPKTNSFGDELEKLKGTQTPTMTGGGGKSDDDYLDAQIKRYQALQESAQKAYQTINDYTGTNIEDLQKQVTVQREIDDITGKLGAKWDQASDATKAALKAAVQGAEDARAEQEKLLASMQAAIDTERKRGDGTAALSKVQTDLNKQLATGKLSTDAYNRSMKEQTEAVAQAALASKRYDDNLGSLAAGFEHAANAYTRSNDLYSAGEQAFTGLTDAMGEGLDALSGKSDKTFGQIASDFAQMLAKMALQAAASSVFKSLFAGSALGIGAGQAGASGFDNWFAPQSSSGGGLFGFIGGLFGGARAVGGPVYPDQSYLVGENGPERFVPTAAGSIQPLGAGSSGGVTVNLDMNQTQGAKDPSAALEFGRRIKAAVVDVIAQEKRPGGTLYARHNA